MDLRKIFKKDTPEYAIPANLSKKIKRRWHSLLPRQKEMMEFLERLSSRFLLSECFRMASVE